MCWLNITKARLRVFKIQMLIYKFDFDLVLKLNKWWQHNLLKVELKSHREFYAYGYTKTYVLRVELFKLYIKVNLIACKKA